MSDEAIVESVLPENQEEVIVEEEEEEEPEPAIPTQKEALDMIGPSSKITERTKQKRLTS